MNLTTRPSAQPDPSHAHSDEDPVRSVQVKEGDEVWRRQSRLNAEVVKLKILGRKEDEITVDFGKTEKLARINAIGCGLESSDLQAIVPARPAGIIISLPFRRLSRLTLQPLPRRFVLWRLIARRPRQGKARLRSTARWSTCPSSRPQSERSSGHAPQGK